MQTNRISRFFYGGRFRLSIFKVLITFPLTGFSIVALAADLALDFQDSPNIGSAGGLYVYSLEARNNGPLAAGSATGITAVFNLPFSGPIYGQYQTYSVSGGSGTCTLDAGNNRINCAGLPDLALNETVKIEFAVRLPSAGVYSSSASVSTTSLDPNTGNNTVGQTTTAQAASDIALDATSNAPPGVQAGTPYAYSLQTVNNGPNDMPPNSRLSVSFQVPSGASVTSRPTGSGWICAPASPYPLSNNELITCTSNQVLVNGASAPLITVPAVSNTFGTVAASFRAAGLQQNGDPVADGNEDNNVSGVPLTFLAGTDVAIVKARTSPAGTGAVAQGSQVTYTLTPRHLGGQQPGQGGNITVTDTLGTGLSFDSPAFTAGNGWTCGTAANVLTCNRTGPWAGGNFTDMPTITVRAKADDIGALGNSANISTSEGDSNPSNNNSTVIVNSSDEADLAMLKSGPRYAVTVGESFDYALSVRNTGPLSAVAGQPIRVTDTLPAGIDLVSAPTGTGWDCSASSLTVIDCSRIGPLANGATTPSIRIPVTASTAGTPENSACVIPDTTPGRPQDRNVSNDCTGPVQTKASNERADLSIVKVADSSTIKTGQTITYTLTVANAGPDISTSVMVEDDLRSLLSQGGVQSVALAPAPAAGFGCRFGNTGPYTGTLGPINGASQDLRCNIGDLAAGSNSTITIAVLPLVNTDAPRVNTATVFSTEVGEGTVDRNNNTDNAASDVTAIVDIQALKTRPSASIPAGAPLRFTASVRNAGPSTASNVRLVDTLPGNAPFLGVISVDGGGSCTPPAVGSLNGVLECEWASVVNNTTRNVVYSVRAMTEGDIIENTVEVTTATEENDVLSNIASSTTNVTTAVLDIVVNKSDNPNIVALGGTSTYTISINNGGPSAGTGLTMVDTFPVNSPGGEDPTAVFSYQGGLRVFKGANNVTADSAQYNCTEPSVGAIAGVLTCTFPGFFDSSNAEQRRVEYVMRAESISGVSGATVGSNYNQVAVSVNETESQLDNNSAIEITSARRDAIATNLVGSKTSSPSALVKGGNVVYTITATNNGGVGGASVDSIGAQIIDPLPAGLQYLSSTPAGACTNSGGTVTCQIGTLPTGQTRTFTITALVDQNYSGPNPLVNQAQIDAPGDTDPSDNDPSNDTPVIEQAVGAPTLSHLGLMMLTILLSFMAWRARRA